MRGSFARQAVTGLLDARLTRVDRGTSRLELPFHPDLSQQHGFFHAGIPLAPAADGEPSGQG